MRWFAIRCCCTPQRILGFLKVPMPASGETPEAVQVTTADGRTHVVDVRPIIMRGPGVVQQELALYSEGRSAEFWDEVAHFVPLRGKRDDAG